MPEARRVRVKGVWVVVVPRKSVRERVVKMDKAALA